MFTKDLAEFIVSTNYHELPEDVVKQAKLCFLDFLGVSLRGSKSRSAIIARNIICEYNKPQHNQSTIIGGHYTNPLDAALANGISAHSLDLDDGHRLAQLHPGACVIPAAISLAEVNGKSGKDFITALVVGYQVAIQVGMLLNPEHREKGFHSTGTCGTLGAAAAAAKILDLNKNAVLNSLGIAGTQAAGLLESDHSGSMAKHLHAGRAAQSGVLSAFLAKEGFTGAHSIIEGNEGILKTMSSEDVLQKKDTWKIGIEKYEILRVYFKKYPVCRHLHSSLDATLNIMNSNSINPADIQDITVETYEIAASHDNYQPRSLEGIRQSLPFNIAIAVREGNLSIGEISESSKDNKIIETASKVKIKIDNDLNNLYPTKRPSRVTIRCEGNVYTERVDLAKGEPENPFSKDELLTKFRKLNHHVDIDCLKILDDLEDRNLPDVMHILNNEFKT